MKRDKTTDYDVHDGKKFYEALTRLIKTNQMLICGTSTVIDFKDFNSIRDINIKMEFPVNDKWDFNWELNKKFYGCSVTFKVMDINNKEFGPYDTCETAIAVGEKEAEHVDVVQKLINGEHKYFWRPCYVKIECFFKFSEPMTYEDVRYVLITNTKYNDFFSKGFSNTAFIDSSIGRYFSEQYK